MREYTNSQMAAFIDEHCHNQRDRLLLKRRMCDGITFDCLSCEFELSPQRVKAIVYTFLEKYNGV